MYHFSIPVFNIELNIELNIEPITAHRLTLLQYF